MKIDRLGKILAENLHNAENRERAVTIHLFGIKYADDIGPAANKVAIAAGISEKYGTEIRKGIKLAKYVEIKA